MLRSFNYVNDGRKSIILIIILLLIQIARVCVFIKEKIDFEFIKSFVIKSIFNSFETLWVLWLFPKKIGSLLSFHYFARVSRRINVVLFEWEYYFNFPFPSIVSLPLESSSR